MVFKTGKGKKILIWPRSWSWRLDITTFTNDLVCICLGVLRIKSLDTDVPDVKCNLTIQNQFTVESKVRWESYQQRN